MSEIINPDGSKQEIPVAECQACKPAPGKSVEVDDPKNPVCRACGKPVVTALAEEQRPPLYGEISNTGIMRLEINLALVSQHHDLMDQFSGFMDRHKAVGLSQMVQLQQQRARIRAAVQQTQAKNGFRGLMDKIRGGR